MYVERLKPHLKAVLRVCTAPGAPDAALERCNSVLVAIADSWREMGGVPFRGCHDEWVADAYLDLGAGVLTEDVTKVARHAAVAAVWKALLHAVASSSAVDNEPLLLRVLRDATAFEYLEFEELAETPAPAQQQLNWFTQAGAARLRALAADGDSMRAAIAALPSGLVQHKKHTVIDRRYDGPKHLRTRDFDNYDY